MIPTKKNNRLIPFLLVAITTNLCSMDEPPKDTSLGWTTVVAGVLLGAVVLKELLFGQSEPFPFTALPEDQQNQIIELASIYTTSESLAVAAHTINSLAQVNKELNQKINDPIFCLQIIKHLAKKFNCSDFEVCLRLKTHAAQQRLKLQEQLIVLCKDTISSLHDLNDNLIVLCYQNADLEFTAPINLYNFTMEKMDIIIMTPLMIASIDNHRMITPLLSQGADINTANTEKSTALMIAVTTRNLPATKELCKYKHILDVNKQDLQGNTALIFSIGDSHYARVRQNLAAITRTILEAGADPELANNDGITPLRLAQAMNNQELIDLINDAIKENLVIKQKMQSK